MPIRSLKEQILGLAVGDDLRLKESVLPFVIAVQWV
jgi:hypothetical protein